MLTTNERNMVLYLETEILRTVQAAKPIVMGKKVILKRGKYAERIGKVTDVMPCKINGLLWLVMVYAKGGESFLNNDGESRQYRPFDHFDVCK